MEQVTFLEALPGNKNGLTAINVTGIITVLIIASKIQKFKKDCLVKEKKKPTHNSFLSLERCHFDIHERYTGFSIMSLWYPRDLRKL